MHETIYLLLIPNAIRGIGDCVRVKLHCNELCGAIVYPRCECCCVLVLPGTCGVVPLTLNRELCIRLWLALYLVIPSEDDKVDTRVAVLKCLLQRRLCPHDVAYRRCFKGGAKETCLLQFEAGRDFLFRLRKSCGPR